MAALFYTLGKSVQAITWDRLLTLLGLWVAIWLGLMELGVVWWLGTPLLLAVPVWATMVKSRGRDLSIIHAPDEDREFQSDNTRIYVRVCNQSGRTINNVALRVERLAGPKGEMPEYSGQRFDVAGTGSLPNVAPEKTIRLHGGDQGKFLFGHVFMLPGNHWTTAVSYTPRFTAYRYGDPPTVYSHDRDPPSELDSGRYDIELRAQGDDAKGEIARFEFWGTENRVHFVRSSSGSRGHTLRHRLKPKRREQTW